MRHVFPLLTLALIGCTVDPEPMADRELEITIIEPAYGAFLGDGPVMVLGQVSDASATVSVEGVTVPVDNAGMFRAEIPFTGDYEVIDIRAGGDGLISTRMRRAVFADNNPADTFPNALTARITNDGLLRLGQSLGSYIDDELKWDEQLLNSLPAVRQSNFSLVPTQVRHKPTKVILTGVEDGLDLGVELTDVEIVMMATIQVFGRPVEFPLTVGYEHIKLGATGVPRLDDDGVIWLSLKDTFVKLDDAVVTAGGRDLSALEFLLSAASAIVESTGEFLVDLVFKGLGEIELGGPINIDQDMLGTQLKIALKEIVGDPLGLAMGLGVGIDEAIPDHPIAVPPPEPSPDVTEPVHMALGVHEGMLDALVGDGVLDMFDQDIDLGTYSLILGNLITKLPGGFQAPPAEGWCLALEPGRAKVVRLHEGIEPLGHLYMPDLTVDIGTENGGECTTWLVANLSIDAALVVDGSEITVDLAVGEGAIMYYGATDGWTEPELVDSLSGLVTTLTGFLGGSLSFDLAELIGGLDGGDNSLFSALGPMEPEILDSKQMIGPEGQPIEGMYSLSMSLWPQE